MFNSVVKCSPHSVVKCSVVKCSAYSVVKCSPHSVVECSVQKCSAYSVVNWCMGYALVRSSVRSVPNGVEYGVHLKCRGYCQDCVTGPKPSLNTVFT